MTALTLLQLPSEEVDSSWVSAPLLIAIAILALIALYAYWRSTR